MNDEVTLPTEQDTSKMFGLVMEGNVHAIGGVLASAMNAFIHRKNTINWWGSELEVYLANQTYFVFEKLLGYSIEETELFTYANKATSDEIAINELSNLYFKDAKEPLYLVVKESPFDSYFSKAFGKANESDFFVNLGVSDINEGCETFEQFIECFTELGAKMDLESSDLFRLGDVFKTNLAEFASIENADFFKGHEYLIKDLECFDLIGSIGNGFVIRVC
ncbi:hypothetical protein CGI42_25950 [Vibrio parahaemolyticus]|uniref:hypothetical protein n=1 Tax=Vibrio parahaemolyticus TaxID=670 RepID=UPI0011234FA7|nr:hypothetical protein [Vibrio parahaemolyticus]TOJ36138.1 hypothetical protein CGI42_25950 [Vibrio parahaemolyticus]